MAGSYAAEMAQVRVDVVSIGALSRNLLWNETDANRTPHATCTLIRAGKKNILVDPGLPAVALVPRLKERTGLTPDKIDVVFLTNLRPAHRAGLAAFERAAVLAHENELSATLQHLSNLADSIEDRADRAVVEREIAGLQRVKPADDALAPQVDLFPLAGYTPGTCGVIVAATTHTVLIASDAVATQDHLLAGQVLPGGFNLEAAKESLQEVYEIADVIIPGHDNLFLNPRTYGV
jgi:glyoxylase-like metal-dependent hydrolase (beta-lactamase superfamily II)